MDWAPVKCVSWDKQQEFEMKSKVVAAMENATDIQIGTCKG